MLCALFSDVPVLAMTATASRADMKSIQDSLGLKNCYLVVGNPDGRNITYQKLFRHGQDVDAVQSILMPIAKGLLQQKTNYPLTMIYVLSNYVALPTSSLNIFLGKNNISPLDLPIFPKIGCLLNFMLHKQVKSRMKFSSNFAVEKALFMLFLQQWP